MSDTYTYETKVGDNCCYFGQVDKVIPQPSDNLLILSLCECVHKVVGKLKTGEAAVCGQALFIDPSDGCLTITPSEDCFYGIAKEGVVANPAEKSPLTVYTSGTFDEELVIVEGGTVGFALHKEARDRGIYFEKRV